MQLIGNIFRYSLKKLSKSQFINVTYSYIEILYENIATLRINTFIQSTCVSITCNNNTLSYISYANTF